MSNLNAHMNSGKNFTLVKYILKLQQKKNPQMIETESIKTGSPEKEKMLIKRNFIATVTTGLERIAKEELEEKLNAKNFEYEAFGGKVLFEIENVSDEVINKLVNMKMLESLWAFVGEVPTELGKQKNRKTVEEDVKYIQKEQWEEAHL